MTGTADIIFCMSAENSPGKGLSAKGILTALEPEHVPGTLSFSVIVCFLGLDTSKPHAITVRLFSDTETVAAAHSTMPASPAVSGLPADYRGINLKMDWKGIRFEKNGEYTLTAAVDGVLVGGKKIYVQGKNQKEKKT